MRRGGHAIGSNGRYNVFANGAHEEHEVFRQQIFIANGEHGQHECRYHRNHHQTNQMNQTLHCASRPVHLVHLVTKKKLRDIRAIRWQQKKPCYPHGRQSLAKVKFSTYY